MSTSTKKEIAGTIDLTKCHGKDDAVKLTLLAQTVHDGLMRTACGRGLIQTRPYLGTVAVILPEDKRKRLTVFDVDTLTKLQAAVGAVPHD